MNSASNYYFNPGHNGFPEEVHNACPAAAHTLLWNDPLHAIVTLKEDWPPWGCKQIDTTKRGYRYSTLVFRLSIKYHWLSSTSFSTAAA